MFLVCGVLTAATNVAAQTIAPAAPPAAGVLTMRPVFAHLGTDGARPTVRRSVLPDVPPGSAGATIAGTVDVRLVVTGAGAVAVPHILAGMDQATNAAVIEALRLWTFEPARVRGSRRSVLIAARFGFTPPSTAGEAPRVSIATWLLPNEPLAERPGAFDAFRQEQGLEPPRKLFAMALDTNSMRRGTKATIVVEQLIGVDGTVIATRVATSTGASPELERDALIAARYCLFEPTRVNGTAITRTATLEASFVHH